MARTIGGHVKRITRRLRPQSALGRHSGQKVFREFADRVGLVYFGYVSQRDDEHRLIRGVTLSPTARDNHYCIGSHNKYDIMAAERSDTIRRLPRASEAYRWLVMVFDFHAQVDIPRIFIVPRSFSSILSKDILPLYPTVAALPAGYLGRYDEVFIRDFTVYGSVASAPQIGALLTSGMMQYIAVNMKQSALEIADNALYVYTEGSRLTRQRLEATLQSGVRVANMLDECMGVHVEID